MFRDCYNEALKWHDSKYEKTTDTFPKWKLKTRLSEETKETLVLLKVLLGQNYLGIAAKMELCNLMDKVKKRGKYRRIK